MQEIPIRSFGVSVIVLKNKTQSATILLLKRAERFLHGQWCQIAGGIKIGGIQ
jgi:dATP pyrophosphohydrolase